MSPISPSRRRHTHTHCTTTPTSPGRLFRPHKRVHSPLLATDISNWQNTTLSDASLHASKRPRRGSFSLSANYKPPISALPMTTMLDDPTDEHEHSRNDFDFEFAFDLEDATRLHRAAFTDLRQSVEQSGQDFVVRMRAWEAEQQMRRQFFHPWEDSGDREWAMRRKAAYFPESGHRKRDNHHESDPDADAELDMDSDDLETRAHSPLSSPSLPSSTTSFTNGSSVGSRGFSHDRSWSPDAELDDLTRAMSSGAGGLNDYADVRRAQSLLFGVDTDHATGDAGALWE